MSLVLEAPLLPLAADDDGVIRVGGTRVPLATVITTFHQGATPKRSWRTSIRSISPMSTR